MYDDLALACRQIAQELIADWCDSAFPINLYETAAAVHERLPQCDSAEIEEEIRELFE